MRYKVVGFVVVKGAKLYLHRRFGVLASRRTLAVGAVGLGLLALLSAGASRRSGA